MAKIEQYSRLIHHRLTGQGRIFTNPTSNDHTDNTWNDSDLYIGEIGINVTDDKMFFRTNNGIVEVGTTTASSASDIWVFTNNNIQIGPSYSAEAITRNTNLYTDIGTNELRFKDVYLGGSSTGVSTINCSAGFIIRDFFEDIISTEFSEVGQASIQFGTASTNDLKSRGLHINSTSTEIDALADNAIIISSTGSYIERDTINTAIIGGSNITIGSQSQNVTYIGSGYNREIVANDTVCIGGELWLRGFEEDVTAAYDASEWRKGQSRLTTVDALNRDLLTIIFPTALGGVCYFKAVVMAQDLNNPEQSYFIDIFGTAYKDATGTKIASQPIIKEVNNLNDDVVVTMAVDGSNEVSLSISGTSTNTIQWLANWEYSVLLNENI